MKIESTPLNGCFIIHDTIFEDTRGYFLEAFNQKKFADLTGYNTEFVQDNHSRSRKGVLRGLHFQNPKPQGKLVRVVQGEVFDVAVDIRRDAKSFGQWFGIRLSQDNKTQLWVPPGLAHGFLVLSETAEFLYKTTDYWYPEHECSLLWNDPHLNIDWPLTEPPQLAKKDENAKTWVDLF